MQNAAMRGIGGVPCREVARFAGLPSQLENHTIAFTAPERRLFTREAVFA
jgi:hypothetical protein